MSFRRVIFLGVVIGIFLVIVLWPHPENYLPERTQIDTSVSVPERKVPDSPWRILCLTPFALDFLDQMDIPATIMADTTYVRADLIQKMDIQPLITDRDGKWDLHQIQTFAPNLILLDTTHKEWIETLQTMGRVVELHVGGGVSSTLRENITRLGEIFSCERDATYALLRLDESRKLLEEKAKLTGKYLYLDEKMEELQALYIAMRRIQDDVSYQAAKRRKISENGLSKAWAAFYQRCYDRLPVESWEVMQKALREGRIPGSLSLYTSCIDEAIEKLPFGEDKKEVS